MDGSHHPVNTTQFVSAVSKVLRVERLSVGQSLAFPAWVAAKRLLIDCFGRPGYQGPISLCWSSEVAGLGSLVQRPKLLKARPPLPERLLPPRLHSPFSAAASIQPCWTEGAEGAGRRAPTLGGEDLQGVERSRVWMLVSIADDLAQVAGQILAGEGQGTTG